MQLEHAAFISTESHTIYQEDLDKKYDVMHARNRLIESRKAIIDFDKIPEESSLKALYRSKHLLALVKVGAKCSYLADRVAYA